MKIPDYKPVEPAHGWTLIDGEPASEIRFRRTTLVSAQRTAADAGALVKVVNKTLWHEVDGAGRVAASEPSGVVDAADTPAWTLVFYRADREVRALHNLDALALTRTVGNRNAAAIIDANGAYDFLRGCNLVLYEGMSPQRREFMLKLGRAVVQRAGLEFHSFKSPLGDGFKTFTSASWHFAYQGPTRDSVLIRIARDALGPGEGWDVAVHAVHEAKMSADLQAAIDRSLSMYAAMYRHAGPDFTSVDLDEIDRSLVAYAKVAGENVPGFAAWDRMYWQLARQRAFLEGGFDDLYKRDEHVDALRAIAALERKYDVRSGATDCGMREEEARLLQEVNEMGVDCPAPTP